MNHASDYSIEEELAATSAEIAERRRQLNKSSYGDALQTPGFILYNDLGNADRFLGIYGEDILYAAEKKRWLIWNGSHWREDDTEQVFQKVTEFARQLYSPENLTSKVAQSHAKHSNNRSGLNAIVEIAMRKCMTPIADFDGNPRDLNCLNGTVDLYTGALREHNRTDKITRIVACDYDPEAVSPTFDKFIRTIQPDPAIRAFLQRSIGYSFLGNVRERAFWIIYGTGNNGKSIFTNLFINLLGKYAATTTAASIMSGRRNAIPNDIARLNGKRFIVVPETEENEPINAALIKALSAGDKVTARFLFAEHFDFYFTGKLWIVTNHMPRVTDHSQGFWDRVKVIPFNQNIPASEVIKSDDLMASLMAEAPGILNWAVQGCRDYFALDGLDTPPAIQKEIDKYKFEQDIIAQFLSECCELGEFFATYKTPLYDAFVKFSQDVGHVNAIGHPRFTRQLREHGLIDDRDRNGRKWAGLRLQEDNP